MVANMVTRKRAEGVAAGGAKITARIRVLIADGHPLIRAGLQSVLAGVPDMLVVGEAANGAEAQHLCQEQQPDVLLLDLHMPGPSALEMVACLFQHCPRIRVLILAASDDEADVPGLVEAGISGCLLTEEPPAAVVQAIRAVVQGGTWFSRQLAEKLARHSELPALTQREREVLRLVVKGMTNVKVAQLLTISETTVKFHLTNLYRKLGVSTRAEAIAWVWQHGFEQEETQ